MTVTDVVIETKGLMKAFKETTVLKGVDLQVRGAEIFALLGSNGAGKTTIINILCTLLKPDGGTAGVCGFDTVDQPERVREQISLTGQFAAVDGILTGRENLVLVAKLRAVPNPARSPTACCNSSGWPTPPRSGSTPTRAGWPADLTSP